MYQTIPAQFLNVEPERQTVKQIRACKNRLPFIQVASIDETGVFEYRGNRYAKVVLGRSKNLKYLTAAYRDGDKDYYCVVFRENVRSIFRRTFRV